MQDILNKMGKATSKAAMKMGNKAGELIDIGKIKNRVRAKKHQVSELKKDIAEHCLEMYETKSLEDPYIEELCSEIEKHKEEIEKLEMEIEEVKESYRNIR